MKQRLDKHFLLNRAFVGTLLAIAVPIALQNLITVMVSMMDTIMIGQLRGKPGRTAVFHFDVVRLRPFIRRQRAHCAVLG